MSQGILRQCCDWLPGGNSTWFNSDWNNRPLLFMERTALCLYSTPSFLIIISERSQSMEPNGTTTASQRKFDYGVHKDITCASQLNASTFSNYWQSCSGISEVEIHMPVIYTIMTGTQSIPWYMLRVCMYIDWCRSLEKGVKKRLKRVWHQNFRRTKNLPQMEISLIPRKYRRKRIDMMMDGETWVTGNIDVP